MTQECIVVRDNKDIRSSVGASLLWSSPLGPIRFDYAFALTKDEAPARQRRQDRRRPHPGFPLLGRHPLLNPAGVPRDGARVHLDGGTRSSFRRARRSPCVRWRRLRDASLPDERRRRAGRSAASRPLRPPARPTSPTWTTRSTPPALRRRGPGPVSSHRASRPNVPQTTVAARHRRSPIGPSREVLALLFPPAMRPASVFGATGISPGSFVHPTAAPRARRHRRSRRRRRPAGRDRRRHDRRRPMR